MTVIWIDYFFRLWIWWVWGADTRSLTRLLFLLAAPLSSSVKQHLLHLLQLLLQAEKMEVRALLRHGRKVCKNERQIWALFQPRVKRTGGSLQSLQTSLDAAVGVDSVVHQQHQATKWGGVERKGRLQTPQLCSAATVAPVLTEVQHVCPD